jgi:hypothetical protein
MNEIKGKKNIGDKRQKRVMFQRAKRRREKWKSKESREEGRKDEHLS